VHEYFDFLIFFIDKQPMKAGQGLKKSLATQRLTHEYSSGLTSTSKTELFCSCK